MTRLEKRQQRKAIQAEYANGMSRTALAVKYGVSRMSISRSLMSDDAYNRMIDQAQARKERVELRIGSKGDRLLVACQFGAALFVVLLFWWTLQ